MSNIAQRPRSSKPARPARRLFPLPPLAGLEARFDRYLAAYQQEREDAEAMTTDELEARRDALEAVLQGRRRRGPA